MYLLLYSRCRSTTHEGWLFFWFTAGSDPESLLMNRLLVTDQSLLLVVLLIGAFTLLRVRQNHRKRYKTLKAIPYRD